MARRPFIAGNWKMNTTLAEATSLAKDIAVKVSTIKDVDVAVCPPFAFLAPVADALHGSRLMVGAQNLYAVEKGGKFSHFGAYTGEVSAPMIASTGATWVILGHSERRQYFGETDAGVNQKIRAAWESDLKAIVCVGETLEERDANRTNAVVEEQVRGCLANLPKGKVVELVIAYEPVWAIGTGRTATPQQAQEVHAMIRQLLASLYDRGTADAVRIQYGGSMKPDNAKELLAQPDIDGGLIGGASLKATDFLAIVAAAQG